jgi:putative methyltransferase
MAKTSQSMKKNVYLFQPQYAVEYRKETNYWLPYSVGCLWSYVSQFDHIRENFELKDLIFRREPPDQVLARMEEPALAGFSCYVWNEKYCLDMAEKIKKRWPNCVIEFGGAQTSGKMLRYDFIDSIIMSEGEENFLIVLERILAGEPPQQLYQKQRLQQLDVPSPYTSGLFDRILAENPDAIWSMTFETNRGCPYACTFCDWGGVTYSKVKKFDLSRVQADLEWAIGKPISYMVCADANFGIFKERDVEIARIIKRVAEQSQVDSVNLQYAKNSTDVVFEIAKIIGNLSRGITVSVQSMNDITLEAIKRKNLDINNIRHLMQLSEQYGVSTYTEVILGLPLETAESWREGLANILEMGQHSSIDMWFAQLLDNSEMAQSASRMQYGIRSIIAKDYMPQFNPNDFREIEEEIELVNQTNTMSTVDMVDAYMYGWMIIHFHINGYSQLYSRYCRHRKNISYRQFYDRLFELLPTSGFQDHFNRLREVVDHYLHTGQMLQFDSFTKGQNGHGIHALSYGFMYENRFKAYALAKTVAESFCELEPGIDLLQNNFIFDSEQQYPVTAQIDFDLSTWQDGANCYEIRPKTTATKQFDLYQFRRQGLLKNRYSKID